MGLIRPNDEKPVTGRGRTRITLWRVVVPLRQDHAASYGSSPVRDVVLVELCGPDGIVGWGECPTFGLAGYVTETTDVAWSSLRDELVPAFLDGRGPGGGSVLLEDPSGSTVTADVAPAQAGSAAFGSLVDARLDHELRRRGLGLGDVFGRARRSLDRTAVIAAVGAEPGEIADRAADAIRGGAVLVKIKISPGRDRVPVRAVTDLVDPSRVAVDANGSYADPVELADIDRIGLAYIEQPFRPSSDWKTLGTMAGVLSTPIALDESIRDMSDLSSAASNGAGRIVSIKPARVGGIVRASQLVRRARQLGLDAFIGGMVELGVGRAGASAVAAMGECSMPTDLGPSEQYFDTDITIPFHTDDDGRLIVPSGPGIGRVPLPEILEQFCVDRLTLE